MRTVSIILGALLVLYASVSLVPAAWLRDHRRLESFLCRSWLCATDSLVESASREIWYGGKDGLGVGTELLRHSVALDPASAYRWCDLGEALLESGDREQARQCFLRALKLGPNSPPILLRVSSFHFRLGETPQALRNMGKILTMTPDYDPLIFSHYDKMDVATEQILEGGIPPQRRPAQSFFRYLLRSAPPTPVQTAWNWIVVRSLADDALAADYLELLLNRRQYSAAAETWSRHLGSRAADYLRTNYLFNGGFEADPTGAPFDWRTKPVEGVDVRRDQAFAHGGNWSLQVRFDGSHNVGYNHVRQIAFVRPGRYRFEVYVRTAGLTTDRGIGFRIASVDPPARLDVRTATVVGTAGWTRLESVFQVMPPAGLVEVQVVREPSTKFDNRIAGTAWIDDAKLLPLEAANSSALRLGR